MKLRIFLAGLLVAMSAPLGLGGAERLSIAVSPYMAFAPADLIVRATIDASDENRAIEIIADSADF